MGEIYGGNFPPFIRMKKALFALLAVPLVLLPVILLAACDLFERPLSTGSGQAMARLSINPGSRSTSRALTTDLAIENADYYEVVFHAPNGLFYQAEWDDDGTGWIAIPVGDYTGVADGETCTDGIEKAGAVMFAGKRVKINDEYDYTLLAIGVISSVEDVDTTINSSSPYEIKTSTKSVTFTLHALENDVNDTNGTSGTGASTFQILAPTSFSTNDGTKAITKESGYPVFSVPAIAYTEDNTSVRPAYDTSGSDFITGLYKVNCGDDNSLFKGVKLKGDWEVSSPKDAYTIFTANDGLTGVVGVPMKPDADAVLDDGEFVFYINLGSSPGTGYCKIFIDVPVNALSATAKHADPNNSGSSTIEWHIRGGIDNTNLDEGILVETALGSGKYGSTGGAVILKIVSNP